MRRCADAVKKELSLLAIDGHEDLVQRPQVPVRAGHLRAHASGHLVEQGLEQFPGVAVG